MAALSTPKPRVFARATEAANFLHNLLPPPLQNPHVAIICGSGLGGLQYMLDGTTRVEVPYSDIPHLPISIVPGHEGKVVCGFMGKAPSQIPVLLFVGRAHFYEGHSIDSVTLATRVCSRLKVKIIIVTNAAGGLNPDYSVGDIVMLNDHLNLAGLVGIHPLRGPNEDDFGVRFPPLSDAYDLDLRRRTHRAWKTLGLDKGACRLHEGVYAFVGGPSYETRAECRMLRMLGADVVGMSTAPEIVTARHSSIRVLAFSLVTNETVLKAGPRGDDPHIQNLSDVELAEYLSKGHANHAEVLKVGQDAAAVMQALVRQIVLELEPP